MTNLAFCMTHQNEKCERHNEHCSNNPKFDISVKEEEQWLADAMLDRLDCLPDPTLPLSKSKRSLTSSKTGRHHPHLTLGSICSGLSGLQDLYKLLDELLSLQSTQQALSHHQHEKWVNELLDGSVRLLDICGNARDVMSQFKENVGDHESALRRRKGDVCIASSINNYIRSRKKMNKDAKKLLAAMKKMDNKPEASPLLYPK